MSKIASYIFGHGGMKLLRALHVSGRERTLRELSELSGMSVGGTQDALTRLVAAGLLSRRKRGNKVYFKVILAKEDLRMLAKLCQMFDQGNLLERSEELSKRRDDAIGWIEETLDAITQGTKMGPIELLKALTKELDNHDGCYALCGGLVASYYREKPRMTQDLDIALNVGDYTQSRSAAEKILSNLGLKTSLGWIASAEEKMNHSAAIIVGTRQGQTRGSAIDFLLPSFPWLETAVIRAQHNKLDFGVAKLAALTPEDMVVAKAFALSIKPDRFQDMDDIQSIFEARNNLDLPYLVREFERHELTLPAALHAKAPTALRKLSKRSA